MKVEEVYSTYEIETTLSFLLLFSSSSLSHDGDNSALKKRLTLE
jgi:hypothetical protein